MIINFASCVSFDMSVFNSENEFCHVVILVVASVDVCPCFMV